MATVLSERKCLSLDEIAEVMRPAFEASEAEKVYLFGDYVRLERLGDPRRGDGMEMLIVADIPEMGHMESKKHFRDIRRTGVKNGVFFTIHSVWSPESIATYGSDQNLMRNVSRDWHVIYERSAANGETGGALAES